MFFEYEDDPELEVQESFRNDGNAVNTSLYNASNANSRTNVNSSRNVDPFTPGAFENQSLYDKGSASHNTYSSNTFEKCLNGLSNVSSAPTNKMAISLVNPPPLPLASYNKHLSTIAEEPSFKKNDSTPIHQTPTKKSTKKPIAPLCSEVNDENASPFRDSKLKDGSTDIQKTVSYFSQLSFKYGDSALRMINADHENMNHENFLRLPSGVSFHTSQYQNQYSWEASVSHILPPEQDLSNRIQNICLSPSINDKTQSGGSSNLCAGKKASLAAELSLTNLPRLISVDRIDIYFGFCRVNFSSRQQIRVHNVHTETILLNYYLRKVTTEVKKINWNRNSFKIDNPNASLQIRPNAYYHISLYFRPEDSENHYSTTLYIECTTRSREVRKYKFKVHGYGGRAVVEPQIESKTRGLFLSESGRYQVVPRNSGQFEFQLCNRGSRCAFASIRVMDGLGRWLTPGQYTMSNSDVILMPAGDSDCEDVQTISFRSLSSYNKTAPTLRGRSLNPNSTALPTGASATTESTAQQIPQVVSGRILVFRLVIVWGEEHQRQRLKRLEKDLGCRPFELFGCGFNDLARIPYAGNKATLKHDNYVSVEDFRLFIDSVRINFIDVLGESVKDSGAFTNDFDAYVRYGTSSSSMGTRAGSTASLASTVLTVGTTGAISSRSVTNSKNKNGGRYVATSGGGTWIRVTTGSATDAATVLSGASDTGASSDRSLVSVEPDCTQAFCNTWADAGDEEETLTNTTNG